MEHVILVQFGIQYDRTIRELSEITAGDDPNLAALLLPQLVTPPEIPHVEG